MTLYLLGCLVVAASTIRLELDSARLRRLLADLSPGTRNGSAPRVRGAEP